MHPCVIRLRPGSAYCCGGNRQVHRLGALSLRYRVHQGVQNQTPGHIRARVHMSRDCGVVTASAVVGDVVAAGLLQQSPSSVACRGGPPCGRSGPPSGGGGPPDSGV